MCNLLHMCSPKKPAIQTKLFIMNNLSVVYKLQIHNCRSSLTVGTFYGFSQLIPRSDVVETNSPQT